MTTNFTLLFFAFCTLLSGFAFSQTGKLTGTLSFEDGAPVAYASVFIQSIKKYSLSDESGNYTIKDIPFGKHRVQISSLEIEQNEFEIEISASSEPLTTILKRSGHTNLSEVQVNGE